MKNSNPRLFGHKLVPENRPLKQKTEIWEALETIRRPCAKSEKQKKMGKQEG